MAGGFYRTPEVNQAEKLVWMPGDTGGKPGTVTPYFQKTLKDISTKASSGASADADISSKADIASPIFTGNPRAPTAAPGDNDTTLATTAFVQVAVATRVAKATFTPWANATGTLTRSTFATYASPTISNPPTQAEVQAISDHLQVISERVAALIADLKT